MTGLRALALLGLMILVVACVGGATPSASATATVATGPASPPPTPTIAPPTAPPSEAPSPSAAVPGSPPIARLAVEGGEPVEGQLGTYTWADGGSDSPWLPGAPISAATGEPMAVTFEPVVGVERWLARIVPAGATGPAGARVVGEGSGPPRFDAPEPGAWTLEVQVTFVDGMGAANYAWALSVS